ncbi:MAG: TerC family protein [Syntrophales bacterium LBB04]|nr:TerC family protein [Syntrophales bacterium LBB04]
MLDQTLLFVAFVVFILAMLTLDLIVFHRRAHVIRIREALIWSGFWIALALLFNLGIYVWHGQEKALEFFGGYLMEYSLSVDNMFVFLLIFSYFGLPRQNQHKILFWGILGALVTRALVIVVGVALIQKFHWIIYIFGAFLILTGIKMASQKSRDVHPERNPLLKLFRRLMPITDRYEDDKFFVKRVGHYLATPLFIVLLVIESTDIIFAVDSIPAVLAITTDPFIVYTSNVFAILGLRALFVALAGIMQLFHYLHYGLSVILVFVGIKMLLAEIYKIPVGVALGVIASVLLVSVIASIIRPRQAEIVPGPADPPT